MWRRVFSYFWFPFQQTCSDSDHVERKISNPPQKNRRVHSSLRIEGMNWYEWEQKNLHIKKFASSLQKQPYNAQLVVGVGPSISTTPDKPETPLDSSTRTRHRRGQTCDNKLSVEMDRIIDPITIQSSHQLDQLQRSQSLVTTLPTRHTSHSRSKSCPNLVIFYSDSISQLTHLEVDACLLSGSTYQTNDYVRSLGVKTLHLGVKTLQKRIIRNKLTKAYIQREMADWTQRKRNTIVSADSVYLKKLRAKVHPNSRCSLHGTSTVDMSECANGDGSFWADIVLPQWNIWRFSSLVRNLWETHGIPPRVRGDVWRKAILSIPGSPLPPPGLNTATFYAHLPILPSFNADTSPGAIKHRVASGSVAKLMKLNAVSAPGSPELTSRGEMGLQVIPPVNLTHNTIYLDSSNIVSSPCQRNRSYSHTKSPYGAATLSSYGAATSSSNTSSTSFVRGKSIHTLSLPSCGNSLFRISKPISTNRHSNELDNSSEFPASSATSPASAESIQCDLQRMSVDKYSASSDVFLANLKNVLEATCSYHGEYVQGMSYLAAALLAHMDAPNSFCCLILLLRSPLVANFFNMNMVKMKMYFQLFQYTFVSNSPALHSHLSDLDLPTDCYLMEWFVTLYAKYLPLNLSSRVWDGFFLHGDVYLIQTAAGLFKFLEFHRQMLSANITECLTMLRSFPCDRSTIDCTIDVTDSNSDPNKVVERQLLECISVTSLPSEVVSYFNH